MKIINLSVTILLASLTSTTFAQDTQSTSESVPGASYINFGIGQERPIQGYDKNGAKRDPRIQYTIEFGSTYLAIPFTYSNEQEVNIFGVKPRFQYLMPLDSAGIFRVGPGVGGIMNYWYASETILGHKIEWNVFEFGVQASAQVQLNILPHFNVLLTPAAFDFNLYRKISVDTHTPFGTFTDDNDKQGILYSFGGSVGFSF